MGELGRAGAHGARGLYLLEGALSVARLRVHTANAGFQDDDAEARVPRVQHGLADAVVGGQPGDEEPPHTSLAEPVLEARLRERRIRLRVAAGALGDHVPDRLLVERWMELGAGGAG